MTPLPLATPPPELEWRLSRALLERRQHPRLPLPSLTLYAGGHAFSGGGDISVGGAYWRGEGMLPAEVPMELGVRLPELAHEVRVPVTVCKVHHVGPLTGVHARFSSLPGEVREAIARTVEEWFLIADASGLLVA